MPPDFDTQTRLMQIIMAMRPTGFIADRVCPRVQSPLKFTISKGRTADAYTIPDTRIGRTGAANRVETGADDTTYTCEDHGLEDPVPDSDQDWARSQMAAWDPYTEAMMYIASLMYLAREKRVADLLFTPANYSGNTAAKTGIAQWNNAGYNGSPLTEILRQMDKMLLRPNRIIMGQEAWTVFRTHPKVVAAVLGNEGTSGIVSIPQVEPILGLEIVVGETQRNSAKRGQAASYVRLWGKNVALVHHNPLVTGSESRLPTHSFTATYGEPMMPSEYRDEGMGVKGGTVAKIVDRVKEVIAWPEAGYLWTTVVA